MDEVRSSSKRANIWGLCEICLCSPSSRTSYKLALEPQVPFASLSSPAVMDIRRLRRRLLEIHRLIALTSGKVERGDACLRFSNWAFVQSFSHFFSLFSFHVTSK